MEEVWSINRFAIGNRMPDLTFYLDVEPEIGLSRIAANQDREVNRLDMESLAFHQKVREGYHLLIKANPERIVVLDANRPIHLVEQDIVRTLEERVLKGF